jgi:hypothetical protein
MFVYMFVYIQQSKVDPSLSFHRGYWKLQNEYHQHGSSTLYLTTPTPPTSIDSKAARQSNLKVTSKKTLVLIILVIVFKHKIKI